MGKRLTVEFLKEDCPLFSRALVAPWRLGCLAAGLAHLCSYRRPLTTARYCGKLTL
jgi:hypothetical protein